MGIDIKEQISNECNIRFYPTPSAVLGLCLLLNEEKMGKVMYWCTKAYKNMACLRCRGTLGIANIEVHEIWWGTEPGMKLKK